MEYHSTAMGKRYTIYDIAKLSGFSPKTVARVINNESNVAPATAAKINEIIRSIDYRPNEYAKNLKSKKTKVVLASINSPREFPLQWMQVMIERVSLLCQEKGITLFVEYCYDMTSLDKSILNTNAGFIDGVIVFYEVEDDPRIRILKERDIPFVVFERAYDKTVEYVGNANYEALYSLFSSLCRKGLGSATMLLRKPTLVNTDRVNGAINAFRDNGKDVGSINVVYDIAGADEAYAFTEEALGKGKLDELIFISGDERAFGVYRALTEKGIRIGEDVSIIGFDNIPSSRFLVPSLSTFAPDYQGLAESLILSLFPEEGARIDRLIVPEFIPRDSLRPALRQDFTRT